MATRHVSIEDSLHELPASNGDIDFDQEFDAPGVNGDNRPFLSYRVNPTSDAAVTLQVVLNDTTIVNETFTSSIARSFNEIFDTGLLKKRGNKMTISRSAGPGGLVVSDLIMVYSADS